MGSPPSSDRGPPARHAWEGCDGDMGLEAPLGSPSDCTLIAFGGLLSGCVDGLLSQSVLGRGAECVLLLVASAVVTHGLHGAQCNGCYGNCRAWSGVTS